MISQRELFYSYIAQTSPEPMDLDIEKAEGVHLIDSDGKKYVKTGRKMGHYNKNIT